MLVRFKDLSAWLKLAILGGWVTAILFVIGFLMGVIEELLA